MLSMALSLEGRLRFIALVLGVALYGCGGHQGLPLAGVAQRSIAAGDIVAAVVEEDAQIAAFTGDVLSPLSSVPSSEDDSASMIQVSVTMDAQAQSETKNAEPDKLVTKVASDIKHAVRRIVGASPAATILASQYPVGGGGRRGRGGYGHQRSWAETLQDSLVQFVIGWTLIFFSVPVLWFNERRAARMECLIARCQDQIKTVDSGRANVENRGWPVHIEGAQMHGVEEVKDGQFNVKFESGCVRLRSEVQVYQSREHASESNRQHNTRHHGRAGHAGGRHAQYQPQTRVSQEWSATWQPSSANLRGQCAPNTKPDGLALGSFSKDCLQVEYGNGFMLSEGLVSQCNNFQPAHSKIGDVVTLVTPGASLQKEASDPKQAGAKDAYGGGRYGGKQGAYGGQQPGYGKKQQGGFDAGRSRSPSSGASGAFRQLLFNKGSDKDGWYYYRPNTPAWRGQTPTVGDARVRFEHIPDGQATVIALQVDPPRNQKGGLAKDSRGSSRDTFLPYRLIHRTTWCGSMDDDAEKFALAREGQKTPGELSDDDTYGNALCCCCSLVAMCCSGFFTPEVFHMFPGDRSASSCIREIHMRNASAAWGLRLVGWIMMFVGLCLSFAPIGAVIGMIPFLGPMLASFGSFIVGIFSFIVTLAFAAGIIVLAYLVYRPLLAFLYAIVGVAVVAIPIYICHALQAGEGELAYAVEPGL